MSPFDERQKILGRIREALRAAAPPPGQDHHAMAENPSFSRRTSAAREWLPRVGGTAVEHLETFRKNAVDLKAEFYVMSSQAELIGLLLGLRDTEGWKKIGTHAGELTDLAAARLGLPICCTDGKYNVSDLENCNVGLTQCDALVAQTGSVLVTSHSAGGRALSVLPPHHVVLAKREQVVRDLPEAFSLLKQRYESNYPSFISFITGPSRTGDIERILVLGAHGPRKLTICCL